MSKVAIVILADTAGPGDFGRAVNGLMTAKEFKEAGDEVQIIFDGAGTKWIGKFNEEGSKYGPLFESVKDKVTGVLGSFTIVAHEESINIEIKISTIFFIFKKLTPFLV